MKMLIICGAKLKVINAGKKIKKASTQMIRGYGICAEGMQNKENNAKRSRAKQSPAAATAAALAAAQQSKAKQNKAKD